MIRRLAARNVLCLARADVELRPGVTLVCGVNHDEGGSNGSGKSALLSVIQLGLFGTYPGGRESAIRHGAESLEVEVVTDRWSVRRQLRAGRSQARMVWGERQVEGASSVTAAVVDEIGLTAEEYVRYCVFGQGAEVPFRRASRKERLDRVGMALGLEGWKRFRERLGRIGSRDRKERRELRSEVDRLEARLQCPELRDPLGAVRAAQDALSEAQDLLTETERASPPEPGNGARDRARSAESDCRAARRARDRAKDLYRSTVEDCPTCGRPPPRADQEAVADADRELKRSERALAEAERVLEDARRQATEETEAAAVRREWEGRVRTLRRRVGTAREALRARGEGAQSAASEVGRIEAERAVNQERIRALETTGEAVDWLRERLGPEVVGRYLQTGVKAVEDEANRGLRAIGGGLSVRLRRSEQGVEVAVEVGGVPTARPSGGQWARVDLSLDLALGKLAWDRRGVDPPLVVLDEAFVGMDEVGRRRAEAWVASQVHQVLVVTHDAAAQDRYPQAIAVEMTDGIATVRHVR